MSVAVLSPGRFRNALSVGGRPLSLLESVQAQECSHRRVVYRNDALRSCMGIFRTAHACVSTYVSIREDRWTAPGYGASPFVKSDARHLVHRCRPYPKGSPTGRGTAREEG